MDTITTISDLVEKLPVMVVPRWLGTNCQPIAIRNVVEFLSGVMLKEETFNKSFDIGGPDILTYREMLLWFTHIRGLQRWIGIVPDHDTQIIFLLALFCNFHFFPYF